ncbi:MAG: MarC family protein [Rhodobacteraceae bacterium]|nr:MarC family protein [Paracoccaceae bacterium]
MDTGFLITSFVTLFVVIDPIGLAPVFIALTQGTSAAYRRTVALRACVVATGILLLFTFFGEALLEAIGISMAAFKIAGGILLFLTALDMLFERRTKRREDKADQTADQNADQEDDAADPSVFPIAIPLISGPGAIASMILLGGQTSDFAGLAAVIGVMLAVILIVLALFMTASMIERLLGRTGITVVTRLLGMLLAALAVQFVLDGIRDYGLVG